MELISEEREIISKYNLKIITSTEAVILEFGRLNKYNATAVAEKTRQVVSLELKYIQNILDAFLLLINGSKIDAEIKSLLGQYQFIDLNPSIVLDLAKIYFYADKFEVQDSQILARKLIVKPENKIAPKIDHNKMIPLILKKIKSDHLSANDLVKINELKEFNEHYKLYENLILAIENKSRIEKLPDIMLQMNLDELAEFLHKD